MPLEGTPLEPDLDLHPFDVALLPLVPFPLPFPFPAFNILFDFNALDEGGHSLEGPCVGATIAIVGTGVTGANESSDGSLESREGALDGIDVGPRTGSVEGALEGFDVGVRVGAGVCPSNGAGVGASAAMQVSSSAATSHTPSQTLEPSKHPDPSLSLNNLSGLVGQRTELKLSTLFIEVTEVDVLSMKITNSADPSRIQLC
jgi:hypothetical protein